MARGLRPRRRGDPAVRVRRHAGGGGRRDRAHGSGAARPRARARSPSRATKRSACASGRAARPRFPAVGRISPDYYCMDGTIPRKRLGEVLNFIAEMEKKYGLRCPNVFHAGDGNLHPLILFDANEPGELERTERFGGRDPRAVRGGRRHHHRRARRRRGEDQPDVRAVPAARARAASTRSSAPSIRPGCSTRARPCRRSRAAPSTAACTSTAARCRTRSCRAFEHGEQPRQFQERMRAARRERGAQPLRLRGGGSKDFYGNAPRGELLDTRALARHRRLRTERAGRHGALRHAARRARAGARRARPVPAVRAAALRRRRDLRRLHRGGLSGPRRAAAGAVRDFVLGAKLRRRPRRAAAVRRPGDEERRRLRRLAPAGRLARHLGLIAEASLKVLPRAAGRGDAAARDAAGRALER